MLEATLIDATNVHATANAAIASSGDVVRAKPLLMNGPTKLCINGFKRLRQCKNNT